MQARGFLEVAGASHAAQLLGKAHQDESGVRDNRKQHAAQAICLSRGESTTRRPLWIGSKFPEALQLLGKGSRGLAESGDRLGTLQEASRQQRLKQGSCDDLALGIERADDRCSVIALLSRGRPAVSLWRPGIERSA